MGLFAAANRAMEDLTTVDHPVARNERTDPNLNREIECWLEASIESLPEEYRAALTLSELERLSQQEVADRLGLSLSGAKSRIQRGRSRLRDQLLACCHLEFDHHGNIVDYERRGACSGCTDC